MRILSKLLPASNRKLVMSSIGIVVLIAFATILIFQATQAQVVLSENGEVRTIDTHADTVKELLVKAGITIGEHDYLSQNLHSKIVDGMELTYKKANKVMLTIDGEEKMYYTVADTVGEFLKENKIAITGRDIISNPQNEVITDGIALTLNQAFAVKINDGGIEGKVWAAGGTVQEVLTNNHISLAELDKVKPAFDKTVTKDSTLSIVRVEKKTEKVTESVAFKTETRNDSSMMKGNKKVLVSGENGTLVKTYEVTYENGKEVARDLVQKEVTKNSENRVVAVGTKEPPKLVTLSAGQEFTMTASAFTAYCNGCSGVTRLGYNLKENPNMKLIAVDPNVIPLGSKVWVEGYGKAIAGDTGGAIKGYRIDVFVPTKAEALKYGIRKVKVKILE